MNFLKVNAKAVAAFLFGVFGNAVTDLVNGNAPWPQTGAEWLRWGVTTLGAGIGAWAFPNKITQKQLDKDPSVPPGVTLLPDIPRPPSEGSGRTPWSYR